jgi:hypothetical protein
MIRECCSYFSPFKLQNSTSDFIFTIIIVVILIICRPSQTAPSSPTSPTQEVEVVNTGTICVKSAEKQSQ